MKSASGALLKLEDRILWEKVARSTQPMQGRMFPAFGAELAAGAPEKSAAATAAPAETLRSAVSPKKPKPHPAPAGRHDTPEARQRPVGAVRAY